MNDALITEYSVVRRSVRKFGYGHKQATAAPSVAGVSEAGDCGGNVAAGLVGIASGATLRRERQSGFCLAAAWAGGLSQSFSDQDGSCVRRRRDLTSGYGLGFQTADTQSKVGSEQVSQSAIPFRIV